MNSGGEAWSRQLDAFRREAATEYNPGVCGGAAVAGFLDEVL
jgi:hypothetical protein